MCPKTGVCDRRNRQCTECHDLSFPCSLPQTCQDGACKDPVFVDQLDPPTGFTYLMSSNCQGTAFPDFLGEFTSTEACFDACNAEAECQYFVYMDMQTDSWFTHDSGVPLRCYLSYSTTDDCSDSTGWYGPGTAKYFRND